jgi:hypothetical protein
MIIGGLLEFNKNNMKITKKVSKFQKTSVVFKKGAKLPTGGLKVAKTIKRMK